MRWGLALAAVLSGISLLSSSALGADSATATAPRVTIFGDSIAGALDYVPEARRFLGQGMDLRLELTPCRRLVPSGCAYQGSHPPSVLDIVQSSTPGQLGDIVVVDVGYNDPPNNYETDMGAVADALVKRGVVHVIWVTLREQTDGYREINQIVRAQARRWPQIEVADWEAASRGEDWFNTDGLHLNAAGAQGLAALLRPYILAACGARCETASPPSSRAPENTRPPRLQGIPVVGRILTCLHGAWTGGRPIVYSYRWLRGRNVVVGAVGHSRRLTHVDRGQRVACRVWAGNASGSSSATSKALLVGPRR